MEVQNFDADWQFMKVGNSSITAMFSAPGATKTIQLPHDAMIHEERIENTPNGAQTGFYPGGQYVYVKEFEVPEYWREKKVKIEFEGVYQTALIYVNGSFAKKNIYGYSNFYVDIDRYLKYGEKNQIRVIADNSAIPNSRWYSGSGIYRKVNLLLANSIHVVPDGMKIRIKEANEEYAILETDIRIKNIENQKKKVQVELSILDNEESVGKDISTLTICAEEEEVIRKQIYIYKPKLWSCDSPYLYQCKIQIKEKNNIVDEMVETIGIRTINIDPVHGLRINGKNVKLRGTCIHHDNGIIGAATFPDAEYRKCRLLKEAGFNSIRSAHHPIGKEMLKACDKYGILIMDELSDVWNYHKNPHDFATNFDDNWEIEVERMVNKDYNHPSVILYSTGNEIPELGTESGARMNRRISNKFHELDPYRYTTMGLNGLMALAFGGGMSDVITDITKHLQTQKNSNDIDGSGANGINSMASIMDGEGADQFAVHPILTEKIEESEQAVDVIGLNYLTGRHEMEHIIHPNKTVIGSETYPADIFRLWSLVEKNPFILGDYTWTGYDYLGEAGCGIFHYDGTKNFSSKYPERLAYIGDIDLVGNRRPISFYREIVYGLRKKPYIAVERVDKVGNIATKTAWMFKDNISSWTWPGYEGTKASIDVYANADEVELWLNGKTLGKKKIGAETEFIANYNVVYEPGEIKAISYIKGKEIGSYILKTAESKVKLAVTADKKVLTPNGEDIAFLLIKLVDDSGNWNKFETRRVKIEVEGCGELQGFGNANPSSEDRYDDTLSETYEGSVLAAIRAGREKGKIKVTISAENCESKIVNLEVK